MRKGLVILAVFVAVAGGCKKKHKKPERVPPDVTITAPANNARVAGTVTVQGTASDNVEVAKVEVRIDGGSWNDATGTDTWSWNWDTTAVSDGTHTIEAQATDKAGNTSTIASVTVTVDNTDPTVTITSPANNATVAGTVTIEGTASDPNSGTVATVEVRIEDSSGSAVVNWTAASGTANWSYDWDTSGAADGDYTIKVRATDGVGNQGETSISVTLANAQKPDVAITSPSNNDRVSGSVSVSGTATPQGTATITLVQVRIDGGSWQDATGTDTWSWNWDTTAVSDGTHTIEARATDSNGLNSDAVSVTVVVDNTAPTVTITSPSDGDYVAGTVTIEGTASDPNSGTVATVEVRVEDSSGNAVVDWTAAGGTTNWSYNWDTSGLADGGYTIKARATDAQNNTSAAVSISVTLDNTNPVVVEAYPGDGWTEIKTGTNIYIVFDNGPMDRASVENNFSLTVAGVAVSGKFYWRTRTTDNAEVCIFVPDNYLADGTVYKVDFSSPPQDKAGNLLAGFSSPSFKTGDCTAPQIASRTPDKDAVVAASTSTITVQFNEDMDTTSGHMELREIYNDDSLFDEGISDPALSWSDARTLVLNLTTAGITLERGKVYRVTVEVQDDSYNWTEEEWLFYVEGLTGDTTAPEVTAVSPSNNSTTVYPRRRILVLFSESLNPSSLDSGKISISDSGGSVTFSASVWEGSVISLYPDRALTGTVTVTINSGVAEDLAGNAGPTADYSFSFGVTPDTTSPSVEWVLPADGTSDFDRGWLKGGVCFSERMDAELPSDALVVKDTVSGAPIKGVELVPRARRQSFLGGGAVMRLQATPKFPGFLYWDEAVQFTFTLSADMKDLAGNSLGSAYSWTITTQATSSTDKTPRVSGWSLDETVDVDVWASGNIVLRFRVGVEDEDNASANTYEETIGTGDGTQTSWSGTLNAPIRTGGLVFISGNLRAWDDSSGNITGDATGTIDYTTGAYSITWSSAPPDGMDIVAIYGGGGLDVTVTCGSAKWRLLSDGGDEYEYETKPDGDHIMPGKAGDIHQSALTLGDYNTFTFTIKDSAGHTVTFTKKVYIPDPNDSPAPQSPDINEGVADTTPTFTWNASQIDVEAQFVAVFVIDVDNDVFIGFRTARDATSLTLPDAYALPNSRRFWAVLATVESPGGDTAYAIGVSFMIERPFWVVDSSLGSISGTITPDASITARSYVTVAVFDPSNWDTTNNQPSSNDPVFWTVAKYNAATGTYTYTFYNLPDGTYYVYSMMDVIPNLDPSGEPTGFYDNDDATPNQSEGIDITGGNSVTDADFKLTPP